MFKKLVVCGVVSFLASGAYACQVPNSIDDSLRHIIMQDGGFPVTDEQCAFLRRNHLLLDVDGSADVLAGVNVGWAAVRLSDAKTKIISDAEGVGTNVNAGGVGSQDTADAQFVAALKTAIERLDWDKAAAQVAHYKTVR